MSQSQVTQNDFTLKSNSKRVGEKLILGILFTSSLFTIFVTAGIAWSLITPAIEFFRQVSVVDFLTGTRWAPRFKPATFGVVPLLVGTLWTTTIALLVAVPFGLGAAMYLSEYASDKSRRRLKPILELLAGIPTVVYGFFAIEFVTRIVLKGWLNLEVGTFSVLSAGLVMGVMIIPTIASLSEDALSSVPLAMRQGSMALGANKMQTTLRVVFPAALSGIAAAVVLGISRAVGETMIVALAAGNKPNISLSPLEGAQTMTGFIANAALGDSRVGSLQYDTLFAVGLLLFLSTLLINFISIRLVRRFREAY
ncbi:MAG: putative phosphate transporter permease protein [Actinomycetota bacterium]|jgi:phosphate transport system permease protein